MRENSIFLYLITAILISIETCSSNLDEISISETQENRLLSRRKRFLVFPDGSSFQLVFCTQNPGYLQIGDIVYFGTTAALAWQLPEDPKLFSALKDFKKDFAQNRQDNKHIYFLDEKGKIIDKVPYKRKPIVNPAFAKRSIQNKETPSFENIIKKMHEEHGVEILNRIFEPENIHFHKQGRKDFFEKIENFIQALGWHGKECVLRLLCDAGQSVNKQGPFFEELLRATFTLPKTSQGPTDDYDAAYLDKTNCQVKYPKCKESSI